MAKRLFILIALLGSQVSMSATLKGTITDKNGEGIPGANVYIKDTYDGATTNIAGQFLFDTEETGDQVLVASFIGYKVSEQAVNLSNELSLDIVLKESASKLTGVTITAGSFEASDENKSVTLKPLDIAMTAGATADIAGALNTLPGTTTNGETGQLFVRGGTANETKAFVNGMLVHNFYNAAPANTPSRGRFSPFLFKGTYFSAGGYSAEYGQALSSILSLNSIDLPEENKTDLSFMSVGGGISHVQKWKKSAVSAQLNYTNLDPYIGLVDQALNWEDGFTSTSGTLMYWHHINKSDRLKVYANFDQSGFVINLPNINHLDIEDRVDLTNKNIYINTAYLKTLGDKSMLFTGVSVGNTVEHINFNQDVIKEVDESIHLKSYVNSEINESLSFKLGGEIIRSSKRQDADIFNDDLFISRYENDLVVGFLESDYYISNKMTVRAGIRAANYSLYNKSKVSPRLSMAYKTSENAQISLAYGKFHQLPENETLIRSNLAQFEESDHYLANYQVVKNNRTFRIEGYFKNYRSLVKYDDADSFNPLAYNNTGDGYAKGVDVFFKDSESIKNGQFWVSYSLIDTERDHQDFPTTATPSVAAKHNFSLVGKYFLTRLKTQVGATFSYNSGRPYNNPNEEGFNASQTKSYQNLSFNLAYLPKQNVIIYASATNLLGRDNIFGYQYENEAGFDGVFNSMPTGQAAKRFLFLGVFITLTKDKTKNQLESLD